MHSINAVLEQLGKSGLEVEYTRERARPGKVPVLTKVYQGFGGLANSHKDFAFGTFLLLYYSQIQGLPASWVSAVIAVSLVIDAVSDPVIGSVSDNFKSRWGRRHPFMIFAAVPFGLCLGALFFPPTEMGDGIMLAWLAFFTIATRLAYTFYFVPWNAVAAEFSEDYVERTSIITYRYLVGWIGGVIFFIFTFQVLFPNTEEFPAGQLNPMHYPTFGLIAGGLIIAWSLLSALGTLREVPYLLQPVKETPTFSFKRSISEVLLALKSRNFRLLFVIFLMFSGLAGVGGVFDIYMNTYFWGLTSTELQYFVLSGFGALASFASVPFLQKTVDKHTLLLTFLSAFMTLAILKVCLRFWGILPENGETMLLVFLVCHGIVMTYLLTTCGIMVGSLIADLVDEQELETGLRQEGVFASAISFASKATSSVGILIGGILLDTVIAFPRQAEFGSVDDDTLFLLALNDGVIIPALFFIPIFLITRMNVSRARLAEIQAALGRGDNDSSKPDAVTQ